jgi:hypothetical protein
MDAALVQHQDSLHQLQFLQVRKGDSAFLSAVLLFEDVAEPCLVTKAVTITTLAKYPPIFIPSFRFYGNRCSPSSAKYKGTLFCNHNGKFSLTVYKLRVLDYRAGTRAYAEDGSNLFKFTIVAVPPVADRMISGAESSAQ